MQLLVQLVDGHNLTLQGRVRVPFCLQPTPQAALLGIEQRRRITLATDQGADFFNPGLVLGHAKEQRQVVAFQRRGVQPFPIRLPAARPGHQISGRHGLGNEIALPQLTPQLQQHASVRDRLHPLGNHLVAKGRRQGDDAIENGQVVRVAQHAAHKALVNLDHIDGQALHVIERRVAGAKVVQRKQHPHLAASLDELRDMRQVFQCAGF